MAKEIKDKSLGLPRPANLTQSVASKQTVSISPEKFDAVLFDMDGVVTRTAVVHIDAWKKVFNDFLKEQQGSHYKPFDVEVDYHLYVDGKPRLDGIKSFLK